MSLEFFAEADVLTKVFWSCALGGTVFFTVRLILMLVGGDMDGSMDGIDGDMDGDTHSDAAFELISVNTLTAFIMMFGWAGLTAYKQFGLSVMVSTVIAIVKSHGGFVWIDSRVGAGTIVDVYLPASGDDVEPPVDRDDGDLRTGNGELILLADDDLAYIVLHHRDRIAVHLIEQLAGHGQDTVADCFRL